MEEKSTKERILEEALRLFAKNGYLGTSMNDIARQLGRQRYINTTRVSRKSLTAL